MNKLIATLTLTLILNGCGNPYWDVSFKDGLTGFNESAEVTGGNYQQVVRNNSGQTDQVGYTLVSPPGEGPFPGVIMVHGGFNFLDDRKQWVDMANAFVAQGYVVMIPQYRLLDGPRINESIAAGKPLKYEKQTYKFPHQIQDISCAIRFFKANQETFNTNGKIGVIGHSSGGTLAMLAALSAGTLYYDHPPDSCHFPSMPDTDPFQFTTSVDAIATLSSATDYLEIASKIPAGDISSAEEIPLNANIREFVSALRNSYSPEVPSDTNRSDVIDAVNQVIHTAVAASPFFWVNDREERPAYDQEPQARDQLTQALLNKEDFYYRDHQGQRQTLGVDAFALASELDRHEALQEHLPAFLMMHGMSDNIVPFATTSPMIHALLNSGGEVASIVYQEARHGISSWYDVQAEWSLVQFMERHLKGINDTTLVADNEACHVVNIQKLGSQYCTLFETP